MSSGDDLSRSLGYRLTQHVAFAAWTVTTALYNTLGISSAAKGSSSLVSMHVLLTEVLNVATVPFIFIFYLFYDIAYTPMLVAYTLEILPFNIRAKGFAVMVCPPSPFSDQSPWIINWINRISSSP